MNKLLAINNNHLCIIMHEMDGNIGMILTLTKNNNHNVTDSHFLFLIGMILTFTKKGQLLIKYGYGY